MEFFYNTSADWRAYGKTILLAVRLTVLIIITACLQVSAKTTTAQRVSISLHNGSLERLFTEIEKKTNYVFFYDVAILKNTKPVSVDVKDASVEEVLQTSLKGQALAFTIHDQTIFVKREIGKSVSVILSPAAAPPATEIVGIVTGEDGAPLAGASVKLKDGKVVAITDERGSFRIKNVGNNASVEITFTGYTPKLVSIGDQTSLAISLTRATNKLDEVQVVAYGTTTQRLSVGNITKVTSKEIEEQPVANPLAALEGRVPGMIVTQTTGLPGGGYTVQIRGKNSILNGTAPFYVIDGVPYVSQMPGSLINSQLGGGSPLNFINPYDIESIEILKDADATAIYGSRAANGAVLITTKKGKIGKMKVDLNAKSGFTNFARDLDLLNTKQYLAMRREAFKNDNAKPGAADHDINGDWDTTRNTNWEKALLKTSYFTDAQASISGGNGNIQYLIGGGYTRQTIGFPQIVPKAGADQKASTHFNMNIISPDKKFRVGLTAGYTAAVNSVPLQNFGSLRLSLAPDAPALFNPDGSLNWAPLSPGVVGTWINPLSGFLSKYKSNTSNLISTVSLAYTLLRGLDLKLSLGYNNLQTDEVSTTPTTASDPGRHVTSGGAQYNDMNNHSWIAEPQVDYKFQLGRGVFTTLVGATFHENSSSAQNIFASGFVSDALLEDAQAASSIYSSYAKTQYKYEALFGRINYDWEDKYLVNLTARRDGSSRFGPGRQFANFEAIGAGWIFSRERLIQKNLSFLSFGKLRGSYGTTGNDQIGDYKFIDLYTPTPYSYQSGQGLYPTGLFNPNLAWERTKKLEGGIELGFLKDRIILQASIYRNRTNNELVLTPVSLVTGFSSIPSNLPALVQNTGKEFVLNTLNIKSEKFTWSSSINLTISRNKLISYPNLATSPYANTYVIGKPITILKTYRFAGINDTTGTYQFYTSKGTKTSTPANPADRTISLDLSPSYYGGFQNSFSYKGFSLNVFFQFVKQEGKKLFAAYNLLPGKIGNQPTDALDHWQNQGDQKPYERFSQSSTSTAAKAFSLASQSDYAYGDASFIRLKNLSVSWQMPQGWTKKMHLDNFSLYVQGQNLLTITKYKGIDPETQGIGIPPARVWTAGIQVGL